MKTAWWAMVIAGCGSTATEPPPAAPDGDPTQVEIPPPNAPADPAASGEENGDEGHAPDEAATNQSPPKGGGRLDPAVIQAVVRAKFTDLRACYQDGLKKDPNIQGRTSTRFVIGIDGKVASAKTTGGFPAEVLGCVEKGFAGLVFPPPEDGIVTVTYPVIFTPEAPPAP